MVTNEQLYLAVGIPLLFNATLVGVIIAYVNAKFQGMDQKLEARFQSVEARFQAIDARFQSIDTKFEAVEVRFRSLEDKLRAMNDRFDDMRELWRAELHRVEGVLDARLSHLER